MTTSGMVNRKGERHPPGLLVFALLLVAVAIFLLHARLYWQWTEDDAFITYRYAHHLAGGSGLVFNLGERIEGYSNLSWVLLAALAERLGADPIRISKLVGLISGVVALLLSWRLAQQMWPRARFEPLLAPYILAISPILVQHSVAGLETSFFAAVLAGAVLLAGRREPSRSLPQAAAFLGLLLLLALTRPEGAAIAFLLLVFRGFWVSRHQPAALKTTWGVGIFFVLLCLAYAIWRWTYFHALLPNTFYAKTMGGLHGVIDGVQYSLDFMRDSGGVFFTALALVPMLFGGASFLSWLTLGVLGVYTLFIVFAGGDWMYHYRFFAHVLPLWSALIAVGLGRLLAWVQPGTWRAAVTNACVAVVLLATLVGIGNTELRVARAVLPALAAHNYLSQNYEELGLWFAENTPPEASIAISDVGAVGYYSGREIIDMFGLIDPHIARLRGRMHYKADPRYVLSRAPDYIVLVSLNDQGAGYSFQRIPDYAMNAQPAFHDQYDLIRTVPQYWNNEFVLVYRRR